MAQTPAAAGVSLSAAGPPNPVAVTLEALGHRRRVMTLWALFWGARSASEIVRRVPDTNRFELHRELEALARGGLVAATPRGWGSGRLEYQLTPLGESLRPLLGALYSWGLGRLRPEQGDAEPA